MENAEKLLPTFAIYRFEQTGGPPRMRAVKNNRFGWIIFAGKAEKREERKGSSLQGEAWAQVVIDNHHNPNLYIFIIINLDEGLCGFRRGQPSLV